MKAAALALLVLLASCGGNDEENRPQCFTAECIQAAPACIPSPERTCEKTR